THSPSQFLVYGKKLFCGECHRQSSLATLGILHSLESAVSDSRPSLATECVCCLCVYITYTHIHTSHIIYHTSYTSHLMLMCVRRQSHRRPYFHKQVYEMQTLTTRNSTPH